MKIQFENDYQKKVMLQQFSEAVSISSEQELLQWRKLWMDALKSWHSPYKALIDCTNLSFNPQSDEEKAKLKEALARMFKFFEGLFMKSATAFQGEAENPSLELLPFDVLSNQEEAYKAVGLNRAAHSQLGKGDFRSTIQIQNHFKQHTVELSFSEPVIIDKLEKLMTLRSKLTNNLMQWHSKWNLLIDCSHLRIEEFLHGDFQKMEKFFKGVFLKQVIGYGAKAEGSQGKFPFDVFRARHKAAAILEGEGNFSGDDAQCRSSVKPKV